MMTHELVVEIKQWDDDSSPEDWIYGQYESKEEAEAALSDIFSARRVINTSPETDLHYPLSSVKRFIIREIVVPE